MINISLLLLSVEEKSGGLFDFDGTLPLTIFQFIGLTFILEKVLYNPLSNIENIRIENLKKKTQKAELTLSGANFLAELYNSEVSNVEKKIDVLLKQDDIELKEHFQKQLVELTQSSVTTIIDTEQDINKKITGLSSNEKVKNASTTIAAIIINQIISK
jgi:F0F1-type ATP synthase membrane subunit b/b'